MSPWPRPVPLVGDTTSAAQRGADPTAWRFDDAARAAFYEILGARRDIRRFRPDPVDAEVLARLLGAAHAAPSVGHSQPWRFVLVGDPATRERAALLSDRERLRQAAALEPDAARRLLDLQLEGIREAPLGIVVCCDRRAPAAGVLGRATFPDADVWSCACAIENLWLAARAEGLGVGWVTLFPPDAIGGLVGLPPGVETLGWLCVGWPDERPPAPGLERAGWSQRIPLEHVVVHERFEGSGPAPPVSRLAAPAPPAVVAARDDADALLTPPGSLGVLDRVLDRLGALGIDGGEACLVLAAADHPVTAHRVSTYPTSVTREVVEAALKGVSLGAAAARALRAAVLVVDAGVDGGPVPGAYDARPTAARGDLVGSDALDRRDVTHLVTVGRRIGAEATTAPLVVLGEVGVGNTTVAAALASSMLGLSPRDSVGLGSGGDAETLARKEAVVAAALARAGGRAGAGATPLEVLGALGGAEIAVLTGVVLGVAARGGALVLDGLATSIAALVAIRLEPGAAAHLVAGQRSRERAHGLVLAELGLEPLLDLRVRAGEGVGALLALGLVTHALATRANTARVEDHRAP